MSDPKFNKAKRWYDLEKFGWELIDMHCGRTDETGFASTPNTYRMSISMDYQHDVEIAVSEVNGQCALDGSYGILWVDVSIPHGHKTNGDDEMLGYEDLRNLINAFEFIEGKLLDDGFPFCAGYTFHGDRAEEKKQRNLELRAEWKLDEQADEYFARLENERKKTDEDNRLRQLEKTEPMTVGALREIKSLLGDTWEKPYCRRYRELLDCLELLETLKKNITLFEEPSNESIELTIAKDENEEDYEGVRKWLLS